VRSFWLVVARQCPQDALTQCIMLPSLTSVPGGAERPWNPRVLDVASSALDAQDAAGIDSPFLLGWALTIRLEALTKATSIYADAELNPSSSRSRANPLSAPGSTNLLSFRGCRETSKAEIGHRTRLVSEHAPTSVHAYQPGVSWAHCVEFIARIPHNSPLQRLKVFLPRRKPSNKKISLAPPRACPLSFRQEIQCWSPCVPQDPSATIKRRFLNLWNAFGCPHTTLTWFPLDQAGS